MAAYIRSTRSALPWAILELLDRRAGSAVGSAAKPAKRVGCALTASWILSLASRAMAGASAAPNACRPGIVSERTCTSIPVASIALSRLSPMSSSSALMTPPVDRVFPRGADLTCPGIAGDDEVVKGLVAGERWLINLLVHPLRTPDWWVQQVPISDQRGRWEARAVFGGSSGERFQLLAIAVPEGSLFREGDVIHAEQIPRMAFKSKLCQVEKR